MVDPLGVFGKESDSTGPSIVSRGDPLGIFEVAQQLKEKAEVAPAEDSSGKD